MLVLIAESGDSVLIGESEQASAQDGGNQSYEVCSYALTARGPDLLKNAPMQNLLWLIRQHRTRMPSVFTMIWRA